MEPVRSRMSIRSIVISLIALGFSAILLGFLVRYFDLEASTFFIILGLLLSLSSAFFYIYYYKRMVKSGEDFSIN